MIKRIGFACKTSELHPTKGVVSIPKYNTGTTTVAWLKRQSRAVAEQKLTDLMKDNIEATKQMVINLSRNVPELRMARLTSDILPVFTHEEFRDFWRQSDIVNYMEREFAKIGDIARSNDVRLSFHPGQFCCLVSENPGIVDNSIAEFEYHAAMARMMGYGKKLLDMKINVHLSGKLGVSGFDDVYNRLSTEARNTITLENDEYQAGLDIVLQLKNKVGIVLDLHHHWINSGEYISAGDDRIQGIIESWCRDGTTRRPVIHYSQSREDILVDHDPTVQPDMGLIIESGHKKAKLRAHSDMMWNLATNQWARTHWDWADCMVEAKAKNLASFELLSQWSKI